MMNLKVTEISLSLSIDYFYISSLILLNVLNLSIIANIEKDKIIQVKSKNIEDLVIINKSYEQKNGDLICTEVILNH